MKIIFEVYVWSFVRGEWVYLNKYPTEHEAILSLLQRSKDKYKIEKVYVK